MKEKYITEQEFLGNNFLTDLKMPKFYYGNVRTCCYRRALVLF